MFAISIFSRKTVVLYTATIAAAGVGCASADHPSPQTARDAETAACSDVPAGERALGPFAHPERISRIEEVRERTFPKAPPQLVGMAVYVRATPGVTAEWLGREIECAAARQGAGGSSTDATGLASHGATARVVSTSSGFKVLYTSTDLETAQRLIDMGRALVPSAS